jgi:Meiotically up-regulated gene 113
MARKVLAPRLYLDKGRNEWIVRYKSQFKRTGASGGEQEKAHAALEHFTNLWRSERTVYLITCLENDFPVKIGSALDLTARLSGLATAFPYQPVLLASFNGDRTDEAKLHARFADSRLRGEWFRRTPELMEFAASIRKFESLQPLEVPRLAVSRALSAGVI